METKSQLLGFITQSLLRGRGDVALGADDDLLLSGMVDSLGIVRLIGFIEEQFGVQVPPEDVTIDHFGTVSSIAGYLGAQVAR